MVDRCWQIGRHRRQRFVLTDPYYHCVLFQNTLSSTRMSTIDQRIQRLQGAYGCLWPMSNLDVTNLSRTPLKPLQPLPVSATISMISCPCYTAQAVAALLHELQGLPPLTRCGTSRDD